MPLYISILKTPNPYFNLSFEDYVLTLHEKKPEDVFLIFYENKSSIVLGKNLEYEKEVFSHKKHPSVLRRSSGGGSVVHFPGNINFGLIANTEFYSDLKMISNSYEVILKTLSKSLSKKLIIEPAGISDLSIKTYRGSKKISGNAQTRKKNWVLHHGTLLYSSSNLSQIPFYLKHPPKEPDYRGGKSHRDFMIKYIPKTSPRKVISRISHGFSDFFHLELRENVPDASLLKKVIIHMNDTSLKKFRV